MEQSEKDILIKCQQGDKEAFRQVVRQYQRMIFSLALKMLCNEEEAKDVVQDTFVKVWQNFGEYDTAKSFVTWIYTIGTRLCLDRIKTRKHTASMPEDVDALARFAADTDCETHLENSEWIAIVRLLASNLSNTEQIDLLASQYMNKLKRLPYKNTKVKLMEQLLKRVINCVKKVNKVKAVSFTDRLNGIIDRYNDRSDDIVLADEIVSEVASQLADLFEEIKRDSHLPDGIPDIEVKAFYDILKSVAERYGFLDQYTEDQYIALAKDVKKVVDDKTQYIDWDRKADIKAQLKVQIILTLAKHGYPPATRDDVFRAIFEQAENFKRNRANNEPPYRMAAESKSEFGKGKH